MTRSLALTLVALAAACGGPSRGLPDYAEYLQAGVVPTEEAERVIAFLGRSDLVLVDRIEVGPAIALGFARESDGARAVRVVTPTGVSFGLESSPVSVREPYRGDVVIDPRSGGDLDADGRPDVVVARVEPHRSCLLVIGVAPEGELQVLEVDARDLDGGTCLEALRDVDGDGRMEAIVALYGSPPGAGARSPRAELPLERDEAGVYRRAPPSVAFLATEAARIDGELARARAASAPDEVLVLAVERAFVLFAAGRAMEEQVAAFDDAVSTTVWPEGYRARIETTRAAIAAASY